ncbi:cupin domain-containing protein [Kallotenue papyrolyticum]|uniref:cupin domain-containing protein n=1 Tax=Kallotenue papyrolyticum TaxID=1325125 RepID=UPI0004785A64|nr:cupin domain-containing protein [Kallotenue papyrolyticum]
MQIAVVHGPSDAGPPSEEAILARMLAEGLQPRRWSDAPGAIYPVHRHAYHKILYVVAGAISFGLPEEGRTIHLGVGDRLELPAGTLHDALVGPEGVVCLEAQLGANTETP